MLFYIHTQQLVIGLQQCFDVVLALIKHYNQSEPEI